MCTLNSTLEGFPSLLKREILKRKKVPLMMRLGTGPEIVSFHTDDVKDKGLANF